jgi:hypothetical protein
LKQIPTRAALALMIFFGAVAACSNSGNSDADNGAGASADGDPAVEPGASTDGDPAVEPGASTDGGLAVEPGASGDPVSPPDAGGPGTAAPEADGGVLVAVTGTVSILAASQGATPSGATVEIVGASPSIATTVNAEGGYSLTASPGTYFVRASRSDTLSVQAAVATSQSGAATKLELLSASLAGTLAKYLGFALDSSKGIVAVEFTTADNGGGYGASLSADHGKVFAFPSRGYPQISSTTLLNGKKALYFANVATGTTTVSFVAPTGHSCEARVPIEAHRVDANVITEIEATCR